MYCNGVLRLVNPGINRTQPFEREQGNWQSSPHEFHRLNVAQSDASITPSKKHEIIIKITNVHKFKMPHRHHRSPCGV